MEQNGTLMHLYHLTEWTLFMHLYHLISAKKMNKQDAHLGLEWPLVAKHLPSGTRTIRFARPGPERFRSTPRKRLIVKELE